MPVAARADDPIELERRGHALVAEGHALLARAAELRARERRSADEWLPASASPLGRRRTLSLARRGLVESSKVGRSVLVRVGSLRAYIEAHRRAIPDEEDLFGASAEIGRRTSP